MNYAQARERFISEASQDGIPFDICLKLLRHASTLQRVAVAQCNGDYPYNGDRDRPSKQFRPCDDCNGTGKRAVSALLTTEHWTFKCLTCQGTGSLTTNERERIRHDSRYTVCPKCETSGVRKIAMRKSSTMRIHGESIIKTGTAVYVCPDCRTQELVNALLAPIPGITAVFGGDPRGAVFVLATPNHPYNESGRNGAYGLYVPTRER